MWVQGFIYDMTFKSKECDLSCKTVKYWQLLGSCGSQIIINTYRGKWIRQQLNPVNFGLTLKLLKKSLNGQLYVYTTELLLKCCSFRVHSNMWSLLFMH